MVHLEHKILFAGHGLPVANGVFNLRRTPALSHCRANQKAYAEQPCPQGAHCLRKGQKSMISLTTGGAYLLGGKKLYRDDAEGRTLLQKELGIVPERESARRGTIAYDILKEHNLGDETNLRLQFDGLASHDITYVGIIQTARASGLDHFPLPYVLTNCHNSLCAVGGTINEDDHLFGLSAAKRYGGIYVPAHMAVIHQYMREMQAGCGKMLLGSDSHTRYGALGTMAVGEGGPELVKQLLGRTYDIPRPEVVCVYLTGKPQPGVGPQDVALAIIGAVFGNGYVKNKILEFVGDGIAGLSVDYRNGIDVMTTETTCLSSVWATDAKVREYYEIHGRPQAYSELAPAKVAYYDGVVEVNLSAIPCMIALPFHPSNVYPIETLCQNAGDILRRVEEECTHQLDTPGLTVKLTDKLTEDGRLRTDQGVIAGCAGGTFENLMAAADILGDASIGNDAFALSAYPASQPVFLQLLKNGAMQKLTCAGASIRTAFCGPCFGAGDVPANGGLSVRHATRNFPNREGSKPSSGQVALVALMDARSVAATARNGGILTPATALGTEYTKPKYFFDTSVYNNRVYNGYGQPQPELPLRFGPGITDWPAIPALPENLLLSVASLITDPVTTTDELIPSGETSSYRSNPHKLAEFTLSRKDPAYLARAKQIQALEQLRQSGKPFAGQNPALDAALAALEQAGHSAQATGLGSLVYAKKPGDGSAREQAASCQRVLGGCANIAQEYATKRYRSNLINWGMLPLLLAGEPPFAVDDFIFLPGIRQAIEQEAAEISGFVVKDGQLLPMVFTLSALTPDERTILLEGCLINFYRSNQPEPQE